LKDVLKLTTGSIVELNRSITEPVEVIVNNCVIARGKWWWWKEISACGCTT